MDLQVFSKHRTQPKVLQFLFIVCMGCRPRCINTWSAWFGLAVWDNVSARPEESRTISV